MSLMVVLTGLLAATALAMVAVAGLALWSNAPTRRLRRGLRVILGRAPQSVLLAPERGRGVAFDYRAYSVAVAWDAGQWGLLYGLEALTGAEVIVDGQLAGGSYRDRAGRPLWLPATAARRVALRLVFDDPIHADFTLELWRRKTPGSRARRTLVKAALEEAGYWLGRLETLVNKPGHSWWEAPAAPPRPAEAVQVPLGTCCCSRRFAAPAKAGGFRDEEAAPGPPTGCPSSIAARARGLGLWLPTREPVT